MKAPPPSHEAQRLASLRQCGLLDTPPEQSFDDLTQLAAHICQTPIALISLIDEKRQWFKSRIGLKATETSRDSAFCTHTLLLPDEVLEVRDAQADPRFADNLLVTAEPGVRFYAGTPLVTPDGQALGALCVMDRTPRELTAEQSSSLRALGRQAAGQIEIRRQARALADEFRERQRVELKLQQQFDQLSASKTEADRLLALAQKSRRALLSVLEDEQLAGQNLRTSEERFRQLAENIQEVFWMSNPTRSEMLYISPAYEKIWGRPCAELMEKPASWRESVHPEDRDRVLAAAQTKQTLGDYDETYRILRPDGGLRWIHSRAFPVLGPDGKVMRIVGIAEDITKRREMEERSLQAQKMEAIGTLAGGIAHDFNNILVAIIGFTELARFRVENDPLTDEYLASVLQGGNRAADLVRQILTFSRTKEQKLQPTRLDQVVAEPLKLLRATIPASIGFDISLSAGLPPVMADATQIHQIVMNLCTNASHAMGGRPGRLTVRLENFTVDTAFAAGTSGLRPGPHVRLTVSDTGCGMDQATQTRIFEPFFTTKGTGEGTGLGLSVVHGIVQSHGGAITVESHLGEGTVFRMYFPSLAPAPAAVPSAAPTVPGGKGERILFVDDEKPLAMLGKMMLKHLGYQPESHTEPTAAFAALRANPGAFDLVITDLAMPGMTGMDLARQIHELRPDLPIILATGFIGSLTTAEMRAQGIREHLPKPYAILTTSTAIRRVLDATRLT